MKENTIFGKLSQIPSFRFLNAYIYIIKKIRGKEYHNDKLEYEGEYLFNRKYNGKGYDSKGNIIYELNNGNGKVKEYYKNQL